MDNSTRASGQNLQDHWQYLVETVGVRLAGSPQEGQAADYIATQLEAGGAQVAQEAFPVRRRLVHRESLDIRLGDHWQRFPCSLFSNTPGTAGEPVEAPLYFFESPAEYQRPDLSHLTGKAVVHLGCHIESRRHYQRLMEARPAFLLFVDVRYPGAVPLADGMFPAYTQALGAVPTVNVAYLDAWEWNLAGASAARLIVEGGMEAATSQNVVADLPGDNDNELLLVGAHHDTQADSPGADDNASGVVALLEVARLLGQRPRKRPIRLISFGAEEQLSVGSAHYVRRHRDQLAQTARFMFNFDSFASPMGWTELVCNGPDNLAPLLRDHFAEDNLWIQTDDQIMPYADHFPFVAAGLPAAYIGRRNCATGRFFHHRSDDDLRRISIPLVARTIDSSVRLLDRLANEENLPIALQIPVAQARQADIYWQDLFGGWDPPPRQDGP
ncbi:MAG: M28 family peptidase [Candidatus Latescibacteria bacterium]|nr:M28 family peptidase [Candidatus Latescibacterota bacterium]